jgi:triacylglycerol lipase
MPPLPPGYNNDVAKFLGAACQLAYLQKSIHAAFLAHAAAQGYAIVAEFNADLFGSIEVFGFAATLQNPARLVIAFRGTDSILDVVSDVEYGQDALDLSPGLANAGQAHEGFTGVYKSLRNQLLGVLAGQPAVPTFITGHSLGGAIASIAALDAASNAGNLPRPTVYTFAAPRAGDPTFAALFDARFNGADITSSWRIVNRNDAVPYLPPAQIFDPFEFETLTYQHVLDWRPIAFQTHDVVENHSLDNYIAHL